MPVQGITGNKDDDCKNDYTEPGQKNGQHDLQTFTVNIF